MKYLLDANVCADYLNGRHASVIERVQAHRPTEIAISSIVEAELCYGVHRSVHQSRNQARLDAFLSNFERVPFDSMAASAYGKIRRALEAKGTPIGPNDLFIAAQAVALGLVLVTDNVKEFQRVPGLRVENWREASPRPTARHK
jgi:tRNA(fMet)-specific endonuclease VapC